jgi:DNA modification methylase
MQLILGDCLEVMKTLHNKSVDAVITDPPYGIADKWVGGKGHGWGRADASKDKRNSWDSAPSDAFLAELVAKGKKSVVWGGNYFQLPPSRGWLVWNKPERGFTLAEAELAWTSEDFPIRVYDCHRSDPDRIHPTQKPLELMLWCVNKFSPPGGTVFDPFMGSGTTGVACAMLGRDFIGIEIDPGYFKIAERRIKDAQAQIPLNFEDK